MCTHCTGSIPHVGYVYDSNRLESVHRLRLHNIWTIGASAIDSTDYENCDILIL